VKDGYVQQLERGLYSLTHKGQSYVDKLSAHGVNPASMPKVITYTLLKAGDAVLLQEKPKQPYMHLFNMIGGKLHEGELAEDAAVREVYEKTGTTIEAPVLVGVFEVLISNPKQLLTHAIAYVFTADVAAVSFDRGDIHLIPIKDLAKTPNLAPDFLPIFSAIQGPSALVAKSLEIVNPIA
jgi:ADP-ribose pyrophosphatase YjhB (NUDIX family)